MELSSNLAIAAGIIVEILFLWETSNRQKGVQTKPGILAPGLSRLQEIIGLTVLASWGLIALAEFFNPPLSLGVLSFIQNAIIGPSFFFLFVFGMVIPKLMPCVNEQTIVVITAIVMLSLVGQVELAWYWLAALSIPLAGIFLIALTTVAIPPTLKSLLYFWYLACLFLMAYQNNYDMFLKPASELELTLLDYFIGGATGIFLLLHSIFLVRFFLMLTALILPGNRHLIRTAMPQLFSDEQMPRGKFIVILLLAGVLVLVNLQFGFAPNISLASVLILLVAHFMDRPAKLTERL
jgi:hypothetical protein